MKRLGPRVVQFANISIPCLMFALCAWRHLRLVSNYAVDVFFGDQWVYEYPTLFHPRSLWGIFRWQSGPWRQGVGGVLSALTGPLTHWNARDESFIAASLVIAGSVLAVFLKVRITGGVAISDSLIPAIALSPVIYQTLIGSTHHGPLPFLSVLACIAVFSSFSIHGGDSAEMAEIRRLKEDWRTCYLAEHNLSACNRKVGATLYSYPDDIQKRIDCLEEHRLNFYFGKH
jgi:hypothetical protein